jgi:hypothetical protein
VLYVGNERSVLNQNSKSMHALSSWFLSERAQRTVERTVLYSAILGFLVHLGCIFATHLGWLPPNWLGTEWTNPISAVYTPFSFILVYEVYLVVYYLPRSITTYVVKQYEIVTLILIRRLFKDLAEISVSDQWFVLQQDVDFTYDLVASLVLFFMLFLFHRRNKRLLAVRDESALASSDKRLQSFLFFKNGLAAILAPTLLVLVVYSFGSWFWDVLQSHGQEIPHIPNVNSIFFDRFFTLLIAVDVLLLLISLLHTDEFHKIIRNSGFIISAILIRLSFGVTGWPSTLLLVAAVVFGWLMLVIYDLYESIDAEPDSTALSSH